VGENFNLANRTGRLVGQWSVEPKQFKLFVMQKTSVKKEKRIIGDDVMTFLLPFPITYL